jgi:hypothetical protein
MMRRLKKDGNHFPSIINYYRNQREMKKMDTQIQTTTKQRETIPMKPTKPTTTL